MVRSLNDTLSYIGVDDLRIDLFESQYPVPEGISYNSYVLRAGKTAVFDTVDASAAEQWKANLSEALAGGTPDYLVIHHLEPDHSGLIGWMLETYPDMKAVLSVKAAQMLPQFLDEGFSLEGRLLTVKDGDSLDLGGATLCFFTAPMVHWPEVTVSLWQEEGVLFSADAFGKFGALSKCGFRISDDADWTTQARRYYFNIVGKYGGPVKALLSKLQGLDVKTICPLHGPVIDSGLEGCLSLYSGWSAYEPEEDGVLVACASIHGGTMQAAERLCALLSERGARQVRLIDICRCDLSEAVSEAFRYPAAVFAASSYDASLFTPMHDFLHRLSTKGYCRRRAGIVENGSWAPSAGRVIRQMLSEMKDMELVEPVVTIRSRMKPSDETALAALADAILG